MKLLLEPKVTSELSYLNQKGISSSLNGIFMNYENFQVPGFWPEQIETFLSLAPGLPVIGLIPANCRDVKDMVEMGNIIASIPGNKYPAVTLPPTWQGLNACQELTHRKFVVCVGPCVTASQAILAAKSNATFVGLFNFKNYKELSYDSIELIQEIKETFKYQPTLKSQILVTSIRNVNLFKIAVSYGADAISVSSDLLLSIESPKNLM